MGFKHVAPTPTSIDFCKPGHHWLGPRFDAEREQGYLTDNDAAHLQQMRMTLVQLLLLFNAMLIGDWLLVPDQWGTSWRLHAFVFTPVALVALFALRKLPRPHREMLFVLLVCVPVSIVVLISTTSTSALATSYLSTLTLIVTACGSAFPLRFRVAVLSNLLMLFGYALGGMLQTDLAVVIYLSGGILMVALTVLNLYGCYRLEEDERISWAMRAQQQQIIQATQAASTRLEALSRFDPLTGAANRRHFHAHMAQLWANTRTDDAPIALVAIDIDHFKAYNDRHGHPQGDACLKLVADAVAACLRLPADMVARFGGEEFVAVLDATQMPQAMQAAERIRAAVMAQHIAHGASPTHTCVTVSVGVACMHPREADASPERLLGLADAALYRSKQAGRNQVTAASAQDGLTIGPPDQTARDTQPINALPDPPMHDMGAAPPHGMLLPLKGFPAEVEEAYQRDNARMGLQAMTSNGLLALLVFDLFLLVDIMMVPDVQTLALQVRLGCVTPLLLLFLLWFRRHRAALIAAGSSALHDTFTVAALLSAAAAMGIIIGHSHSAYALYYHAGFMVIIMYGNLVHRIQLRHAVLSSLAIYAINLAGLLNVPEAGSPAFWGIVVLTGASLSLTLRARYMLDMDARLRFWLTRRGQHLIGELEQARARLETLSNQDPLTGLYNRRFLQASLERIWLRAAHDHSEVAIIMIDVDHFKQFNDRYGHPAGDQCLMQVAEAMRACLHEPPDLLARYGGEEFIAVLPGANRQVASAQAEQLRQAIEALAIPHQASNTAKVVTASIGVCSLQVMPGMGMEQLIDAADAALYEAKRDGRNRVACKAVDALMAVR